MKITQCMNCMEDNNGELAVCPHCGFNEAENPWMPHQLPYRTVLNGKYMVGKAIGEGGFGITYIGWDLNLGIKVAIKEFYPEGFVGRTSEASYSVRSYQGDCTEYFNKGKEKFLEEARSLGKFMELPGIVSVKDFFMENNTVYIVMEYVDGKSLKSYAKECGGKIEKDKLLEYMEPVIKSLMEVHKAGIIHRDISPDNIMICKNGQMKLIDFGAARESSPDGEKTMSVMLKKGYSPEEQYRSRGEQGTWTDVYSLSATIYAMLTGIKPDEPFDRMEEETLKKPSQLGVNLTKRQEDVLMKGLAIKAQERIQTMDELYQGLYVEGKVNEFEIKKQKPRKVFGVIITIVAALLVVFFFVFAIPVKDPGVTSVSGYEGNRYTVEDIEMYLPVGAIDVRFRVDNIECDEFVVPNLTNDENTYMVEIVYESDGREHVREMNISIKEASISIKQDYVLVPVGKTVQETYSLDEYGWNILFDYTKQDAFQIELLEDTKKTASGQQEMTAILTNNDIEIARTTFIVDYYDIREMEEQIYQGLEDKYPNLNRNNLLEAYADTAVNAFPDWDKATEAVNTAYPNAVNAGRIGRWYTVEGEQSAEDIADDFVDRVLNAGYVIPPNVGIAIADDGYDRTFKRIDLVIVVYFDN